MRKNKTDGYTEEQLFDKFTRTARYLGGGCYTISFFGTTLHEICTLRLKEKWMSCFTKKNGRYYYS